jgi:hypothetical protein
VWQGNHERNVCIPGCDTLSRILVIIVVVADTEVRLLQSYFTRLESLLGIQNFRLILIGDFNMPNFNRGCGLSMNICHYYSKQEGDAIYIPDLCAWA